MKIDVTFSEKDCGFTPDFGSVQVINPGSGLYEKGYSDGKADGQAEGFSEGQQAQEDAFWEVFQGGGARSEYPSAFRTTYWTDEIYKPKYPILAGGSTYMYQNTAISNTIVPITFSGSVNYAFAYTLNLHTIPLLTINGVTSCTGMFRNAYALENVTFAGEWTLSGLEFTQSSKLTVASILSLFAILADYSGTSNHTLTLGSTNLAKLTDAQKAIATQKGWTLA